MIDLETRRMSRWGNDKIQALGQEFKKTFPGVPMGQGLLLMLGVTYTSLAEKIGIAETDEVIAKLKPYIAPIIEQQQR